MDCPSTPGAPLLALTCRQARQTSYPETANGFPSNGPPDTDLRPAPDTDLRPAPDTDLRPAWNTDLRPAATG